MKNKYQIEVILKHIHSILSISIDYDKSVDKEVNLLLNCLDPKIRSKFAINNYKLITMSDRTDAIYDETDADGKISLFIQKDYFFDQETLKLLLVFDFFRQILINKFDNHTAYDCAFALLYDSTPGKKDKNKIIKIWKKQVKPQNISPTVIYDLSNYLLTVTSTVKNYHQLFLNSFINNYNSKLDKKFPYTMVKTSLKYLKKNDILVLSAIVTENSTNTNLLAEKTGISRPTVIKAKNTLLNTFILRERMNFSPNKIGLTSIIGIIPTKRGNGDIIKNIQYPMIKFLTYFRGTEDLIYFNFYIPSTEYAINQYKEWVREIENSGEIEILTSDDYFFGIELENFRINYQNPSLFDADTKEWRIGDINNEIVLNTEIDDKLINLDKERREIAKIMMQRIYSKEELYNKVKGNRNKVNQIFNEFMENNIIYKEFVIPFFDDLSKMLLIYNGIHYERMIREVASIVPVSVNFMVENNKEKTGISFLSVPFKYLDIIFDKISSIDNYAKISLFPIAIQNTLVLENVIGEYNWKFNKLPNIKMKK